MMNLISQYIQTVDTIYQTGETTEHSFRGALETLLNSFLPKPKRNSVPIHIINEPKRKEYGAPDFELRKGDTIISFIETKDLFDKDLRGENNKVHKEQFDRYKKAINTIAFTDYLEFVLYEKGEETLSAKIAEQKDGHIVPTDDEKQISAFTKLLSKLIEAKPQPINSARILAETLAAKAKVYNPQNEMFAHFQTKCIIFKNETQLFKVIPHTPKISKKIDRLRRNFIHLKAVRTPS